MNALTNFFGGRQDPKSVNAYEAYVPLGSKRYPISRMVWM
jgi:hypothetical protein